MRDMSIWGLMKQLYQSDWAETKDATPWDCTFAAGECRDDEFARFRKRGMGTAKTWYRSYCMSYVSIFIVFSFPHTWSVWASINQAQNGLFACPLWCGLNGTFC